MRHWLTILTLLPLLVQGQQNLVPNGGFEDYCPNLDQGGAEIWNVQPWDNIVATGGGADPFNVCAQLQIITTDTFHIYSVPENNRGYQFAHSGDGYAGFYAVSDPETYPNGREFIQTSLTRPLHAGVRYEVKFYVSLTEKFQYAIGSFGVHFSIDPLQAADYYLHELPFGTEPQIQSPSGVIYDDKENWMEVRDTLYIPRTEEAGQQWMTIGNFLPDTLSQITFVDSGAGYGYDRSYYYIDDVSVIALDSVPSDITGQEALGFDVWPNPATDVVRFSVRDSHGRSSLGMTIRVLDAVGREVRHSSPSGKEGLGEVDVQPLPTGIYFLELTGQEGRKAVRKFVKQ
ncbi:MAG TPA: hypothetical protein DCR04_05275 [Flavobacteriales bacterium]|nr:hypothetical protein [Flavobacteriales bacterium]